MAKRNSLAKNTIMLYILTASTYVFGFITIPYLTRVLGAEVYGQVGFATAFCTYLQLVMDFGFMLSATKRVAEKADDSHAVSQLFTSVVLCKLILISACAAVVAVLCIAVGVFNADPLLFFLFFAYAAVNTLLPDFVYRGKEKMTAITVRTVIIKALFLVCIFIFIQDSSQYHLVPVFYLLGSFVAVCITYTHIKKTFGVTLVKVNASAVMESMKESLGYFVSRIASTFYSTLNVALLGFVMPGSAALGLFTACNNVVNAGKNMCSPFADALYPYMIRTKNYKVLLMVVTAGVAAMSLGVLPFGIFSYEVCAWFFGEEYRAAGEILRYMLPLIPIAFASYIFGFPALTPLGQTAAANNSVVAGAVLQVVLLLLLWAFGGITAVNVCIATIITEVFVLGVRFLAFAKAFFSRSK